MLTHSFNDVAEHQKETDFNYSMKADDIGRIAKNNFQEHKSETAIQKKKERNSEALKRLLHQQDIMDAIDAGIARANEALNNMEEEKRMLDELAEKIHADDPDALRKHIEETYDKDTTGMSDEEVEAWAIDRAYQHIDSFEKYEAEYLKEMEQIQANIDRLKASGASKEQIQQAIDKRTALERRYENIGDVKGYDFNKVSDKANQEIKGLDQSKETEAIIETKDDSNQTNDGTALTKNASEVAQKDNEIAQDFEAGDSPFPEMEDVLSNEFNIAANGEDTLDVAIENVLDGDMELAKATETVKLPTLS